ncbi:MAG: hypothetical protein EPO61_10575 [Nitrospirae bacterium]|nr:MAG: hypothetical protein EPO61_10575 [Nitrospirota bacterium]
MATKFIGPMVMAACLALSVGCAEMSSEEVGQSSGGATPSVASARTGIGAMAAGAVGDTLQACQARIPSDASAGQRMIAEQSCGRDQGDRKLIQAVPGR